MGAQNTSNQNKSFVNIVSGKFAFRVKEGVPNAVARVNKNNVTVHELLYDTLSNMSLTKIQRIESNDYGPSWEITLREADDVMVLNLPYSGRTTNGLFHRLPNINLSLPITLKVFNIEDKNKPGQFRAYLTIEQGGKKIEPAFTKENPNGLPPMEQITVKGKLTWDDSKQMAYIEKMINEIFIPKLEKLNQETPPPAALATSHEDNGVDGPDADDLPF